MRYMGGKFRQSKAIVRCLKPHFNDNTVYVEPFCGGMWSACRVIDELHPKSVILNDINKPLMLLRDRCIRDGVDWLPTDSEIVEREYRNYRLTQDENDPLTAWYGIALSFGGKWFGGVARHARGEMTQSYEPERKSMYKKVDTLKRAAPRLLNTSYEAVNIPDGAVVYCDPPYARRTKAHHFDSWDDNAFWQWVRDLSSRCVVFVSCFDCPPDFETVDSWGDTVVRHLNGKGSDGTCERLVKYNAAEKGQITEDNL